MKKFRYDQEAELRLFQDVCRNSFWHFLLYAFGVNQFNLAQPDRKPWLNETVHRPLIQWLDRHVHEWRRTRFERRTPKKLMVIWPRGFGKTTIVTKACQLWLHVLDPEISTITDSVTTEKSWDFLQALKNIMDGSDPNAWFTQLYGNWKDQNRPWKQGFLTHALRKSMSSEAASMICSSVEKGITGKHPDALFIDDPIVQERMLEGLAWLDKVNKHMDAMIPALRTDGLLVATATRYHDSDWLGKYMREEGVRSLEGHKPPYIDFKVTDDGEWELYFLQARNSKDEPVLPGVWNEQALKNYESKNVFDFQAQMMNAPGEGEHMPITREQMEHMFVKPDDVPGNLRISIHCDLAWKDKKNIGKGDFSVIQVWGHSADGSGEVYFLEGYRSNTWRSEDFFEALGSVVQKLKKVRGQKPFVITMDKPTGGISQEALESQFWNQLAQLGVVCPPVLPIARGNLSKELRIRWAAAYWVNGKVWLVKGAPGLEPLISEMLRIGVSAHDDMADAAADVFHEEVYSPEVVFGTGDLQPAPVRRPLDEYLQMPLQAIDEEGVRELYDRHVEREEQAWIRETWGIS